MKIKKLEKIRTISDLLCSALPIVVLSAAALAICIKGKEALKNYLVYDNAPIIKHEARRGESLLEYFECENMQNNLDFDKYKTLLLKINEYNFDNEYAWPDIYYNIIKEGKSYNLLDINRDGKVGAVRKVNNYDNFLKK